LSFDLRRSLRRFKSGLRAKGLIRRPDEALPFVPQVVGGGPELLLDTCVYIDVLQRRAPEAVKRLMAVRLCGHSGIALAELTYLFGRLDPRDPRTTAVTTEILGVISDMPSHRLSAPSLRVFGEAGILAGLTARLAGVDPGRRQSLFNDSMLYLQALANGQIVLTRNIREFDWFDQLLPLGRVLFYRQEQPAP
jgi:predicted nucleic acid-binding protein